MAKDSPSHSLDAEIPVARWRRPGHLPGRFATALVLLALTGLLIVRLWDPLGDGAVRNIMTLIFGFTASVTLLLWFAFFSAYPQWIRRGVFGVVLVTILVAVAVLRIERLSGDLVPEFQFRWAAAPDRQLPLPQAEAEELVELTSTPHDFPQYLGPERRGNVPGLRLDVDWKTHPPKLLWKQPIGAGWSGFAVVNGFAVTMEQRGDQELVTCYEVLTGKLRWQDALPVRHETALGGIGPRATPTIDAAEQRVYAMGATGVLRCIDGRSGKLLWSRNVPEDMGWANGDESSVVAWGRANSPLIDGQLVIVPAGGPSDRAVSLVAYDKQTGAEQWRAGSGQISYSSPVMGELGGVRQLVIVMEDHVSGHDVATGAVLWTFPWYGSSSGSANTSQPLFLEDGLLVSKGYGQGAARWEVSRDAGNDSWTVGERWANRSVLRTKLTSPVLRGNYAFGLSEGILECVDVRDGRRQWKGGRYGHGQVLLVDDVLLVLTEDGRLVLVEAQERSHVELAELQALEGQTWNTLALYGPYLLVRNAEQAACYELKLADAPTRNSAASPQE